ncbi:hypothetical protein JCM10908_005931 [Rhodotorula pacifica]|uniref:uncharacterized protein n=1 Tax=Rhodotorula pacifica TaxID=1495444 RepID=UPI00316CA3A6
MATKSQEAASGLSSGGDIEAVLSRSRSRTGVAPEDGTLKIRFSPLSMALFCFVVMSTAPAWAGSLGAALYAGGPTTMVFGFLIVFIASLCGAASLAEMVSIWPTAEGQIAWTEKLAPARCASFLRYWVAWLTAAGWIAITMSACFICSVSITAIAAACNSSYVPKAWHTAMIFWALALFALAANVWGTRLLSPMNNIVGAISLSVTIVIVIVVLARHRGDYNSAKYVFTELVNETGYSSKGIVFIIGMVSGAYSIMGYDSIAHLCEEMHEPAINAPKVMIGSVLSSLPAGMVFILAVLFTIKDIDAVATQMFPILYILEQATRNLAGAIILTIAFTTLTAGTASIGTLATAGRVVWSMSLEGGIPYSRWFTRISTTSHAPVRAMVVIAIIEMLLVLIYIGNAALFNSIIILAISFLNLSYAVPTGLMLFRGRPSGHLPDAPFRMPRWLGMICNSVALVYQLFISFMLFVPTLHPVSASNMNYACALFGGAHIVGGIYWFFGGRKRIHAVHDSRLEVGEGNGIETDEMAKL